MMQNYRPMRGLSPVVKNLLIINVLLLLFTIALQRLNVNLNEILGMFYPLSKWFMPHQFVTSMFMHADISHLFFNMFALFMFGGILEQVWGGKRFLIYYMATGMGAIIIHTLVNYIQAYPLLHSLSNEQVNMVINEGREAWMQGKDFLDPNMARLNGILNTPVIGASGAIFGILLAFGMLFPNTELMLLFPPIPIKAKYFVVGYGLLELYFGIANQQGDNVAHFAHLGGMLFGFILIKYWKKNRQNFY